MAPRVFFLRIPVFASSPGAHRRSLGFLLIGFFHMALNDRVCVCPQGVETEEAVRKRKKMEDGVEEVVVWLGI